MWSDTSSEYDLKHIPGQNTFMQKAGHTENNSSLERTPTIACSELAERLHAGGCAHVCQCQQSVHMEQRFHWPIYEWHNPCQSWCHCSFVQLTRNLLAISIFLHQRGSQATCPENRKSVLASHHLTQTSWREWSNLRRIQKSVATLDPWQIAICKIMNTRKSLGGKGSVQSEPEAKGLGTIS